MCSDFLSPSFGCLLRVLAPGVSPGFVASAVLNRIRGFRDFNSVNLYEQQLVFLSSFVVSMFDVLLFCGCTLSSTVCTCKTCQQSKPTVVTDFFRGVMTPTLTAVRPGL